MDFSWKIVIDAGAIAIALLFSTLLRAKVRFFQKYLIPNALTAGFLLLPIYNFILPLFGYSQHKLGELVYHLLNISFIAMTLRSAPPRSRATPAAESSGWRRASFQAMPSRPSWASA